MQAARQDLGQSEVVLTIVGDDQAGALAEALRRKGPTVRHRALTDTQAAFAEGPVLAVGIAAADGGATLRRRVGKDTTLFVVLPAEDVGPRLEAFRQGALVVDATVAADTAQSVIDHLDNHGSRALGWVGSEDLMEAIATRLAVRLGTGRGEHAQIKLEDGRALAEALDRFGDALAALSSGTRVVDSNPASSPPARDAAVSGLDWEDDPQTMKADLAEVEQYRKMAESPGSAEPTRPASGVVATERGRQRGRQRDLSLELSPLPVERGEPAPRTSLIRALRPDPIITAAEEPLVTLASNASSIELPALPGEAAVPTPPLPAVLDPFAPACPPAQPSLEERLPEASRPPSDRWGAQKRFPLRLETADTSTPAWVWVLLMSLAGLGALAAWWMFSA